MITQADIGHEVGDPDAHWDMRGELLSLSEPGPGGSMCEIPLVGSWKVFTTSANGFVRTNGRPVHKSEKDIRNQRLRERREQRREIDKQIRELEAEAP